MDVEGHGIVRLAEARLRAGEDVAVVLEAEDGLGIGVVETGVAGLAPRHLEVMMGEDVDLPAYSAQILDVEAAHIDRYLRIHCISHCHAEAEI